MAKIVIVGAGFSGLAAALGLKNRLKGSSGTKITLVDRRDYHLYYPDLHEVACAEEEFSSLKEQKSSVALPLGWLAGSRGIDFFKGEVVELDAAGQRVRAGTKWLEYDYLVLAAGMKRPPAVQGEAGLFLDSLADAFRIQNDLEFAVQSHRLDAVKKNLRVAVVGGGCLGVALAGELKGFLDILSWKYQYPREKIELVLYEGGNRLLPGFPDRVSAAASLRLAELGVRLCLDSRVSGADQHYLNFSNGERSAYDVLLWSASKGFYEEPAFLASLPKDGKGRILVNEFFQVKGSDRIFAIGEAAAAGGDYKAGSAYQEALSQGRYVAYALPKLMNNARPSPYSARPFPFSVFIGGKWAVASAGGFIWQGFSAYLIAKTRRFLYFAGILGLWRAFWLTWGAQKIHNRND